MIPSLLATSTPCENRADRAQIPLRIEKVSIVVEESRGRASATQFPPTHRGLAFSSRRKVRSPRVPVGRQFRPGGRKSSPRLRAVYTAVNQLIASPLLSRFSFSLSLLLLASPGRGSLRRRGVTGRIRPPHRYSGRASLRPSPPLRPLPSLDDA